MFFLLRKSSCERKKKKIQNSQWLFILFSVFPQEVDVSINGVLPIAYTTKGLTMQPNVQCLNDPKPYKEGAGSFKLLPSNNSSSGGAGGSGGSNSTKNDAGSLTTMTSSHSKTLWVGGLGVVVAAIMSV